MEIRYISQQEVESELGWTKQDADELFELAKTMPRIREDSVYAGKVTGKKRIIGLGSFSISANKRGVKDGVVNPKSQDIKTAPPVVDRIAEKLTQLNSGKAINYLSFIAYENERDHIGWHQHNEDRCRDATVYIVSMGEVRTFGIRRVCESHRICDKCNASCHADSKTLCKKCRATVKARKTCKDGCESTPKQWRSLQPEHGSIIVLPHEYNLSHEHAILGKQDVGGDKGSKGLRISINTKNIREEDLPQIIPSGQLPSNLRAWCKSGHHRQRHKTTSIPGMLPLSAETIHKGIAPGAPQQTEVVAPRVYSIKRKHPSDAIYVGCAGKWKGCKCHANDINSGSMYGNSYKPRVFGGHAKNPIAKTPQEYREKLEKKWNSTAPKDAAWRERAVKELRGKNLLCWCFQPEDVDGVKVTAPTGCHARVLLEFVNREAA